MTKRVLIYWIGIVGIPGKGANWMESYVPDRTLGQLIQTMKSNRLGDNKKRIEILKFQYGNLDKYDRNNPYWSHDTKLSEYLNFMGGWRGSNDLMLVYCIV
jgi:hypothetical protein